MGSIAHVAHGYATLASELVTRWGDHADAVATKVKAGDYGADDAVNDLAKCAFIATEGGFLVVNEAVEAIAVCSGSHDEPYEVESQPYDSPLPGATLQLAGALTEGFGDAIPVSAVTIVPAPLDPGQTRFRLHVNASGRRAAIYRGVVHAADAAGATADINVKVQVA